MTSIRHISTILLVIALTVIGVALARAANLPACNARAGEVCIVRVAADAPVFQGFRRSTQMEMERYVFVFRSSSGAMQELVVVRDDSIGVNEGVSRAAPPAVVETRVWNGVRSGRYSIANAVPGVTAKVCVESVLWPQCKSSGTLTRLRAYRG